MASAGRIAITTLIQLSPHMVELLEVPLSLQNGQAVAAAVEVMPVSDDVG